MRLKIKVLGALVFDSEYNPSRLVDVADALGRAMATLRKWHQTDRVVAYLEKDGIIHMLREA